MLEKKFNIPEVINCELKYLSDSSFIGEITETNARDVLMAKCKPLNLINHQQAMNFPFDYVKEVLNELKKIEIEYPDFYNYFDINYNRYEIGFNGQDGIALSINIRPIIKLKCK